MKKLILVIFLLLAACDSPSATAPAITEEITMASPSSLVTSPATTVTNEPCAFVPAYQSLADISAKVDRAIKSLQPEASGRAQAYGENCVYADGHADFHAMETDFYVTANVTNLKDNNELGTWIINAMKALASFSPGTVPGPQPGFVEFTFKSKDDRKSLRVSISKYEQLPSNLSGADVIKALFPNP
ncbi:MAG: hypothetical protein M1282_10760 [Chloroflexi bacterium]|nr:hypothetical protein [Chloroflexota bacterium]